MDWFSRTYYWLAERLYNEFAWAYDPVSWLVSLGGWSTVRSWVVDFLAGRRVLEIGFGTGDLLIELAELGYMIHGLELSKTMHRQTAKKLDKSGLAIPRVCGVAQQMPFDAGSYDTIISTYPAGYIFDPQTWREAARLTMPPEQGVGLSGVRFVIVGIGASSSNDSNWIQRKLFGFPLDGVVERCRLLAQEAGFNLKLRIRKYKGLEFPILLAEN